MMKNKSLTLASLFDGSGGFPLAGIISGITPVWASEIEPFPVRVTTKRMPWMKHYGDVSAINGAEVEPVDIVTFGSPCQDLSTAGKRAGLDGERSGLFREAVRIIKEMRLATNGEKPRFCVWENVPGAFSSNGGEDFRAVLEAIAEISGGGVYVPQSKKWEHAGVIMGNGYSIAWRVLDAQFWGVPQRRKRIYLVADFAGGCAGKILFESEGLSGYTPQGFRSWQGFAGAAEEGAHPAGVGTDGYNGAVSEVAATLGVNCGMSTGRNGVMVLENHPADCRVTVSEDGKVQTLTSRMGTGGNNVPLVMKIRCGCEGGGKGPLIQTDKSATLATNNDQTLFVPAVFGICSKDSNAMKSANPHSGFYEADTSRTLDGNGGNPSCNQGGMAVVALEGNGARPSHRGSGYSEDNVSFTLNATEQHAVAVEHYCASKNSFFMDAQKEQANTLVATDYKDPPLINDRDGADYIVRRLTPTECARLQGFPDWWCDGLETENPTAEDVAFWEDVFETHRRIVTGASKPRTRAQIVKWLKSPHTDGAEYKMWGNGVALPCVVFVLSGIAREAGNDAAEEFTIPEEGGKQMTIWDSMKE